VGVAGLGWGQHPSPRTQPLPCHYSLLSTALKLLWGSAVKASESRQEQCCHMRHQRQPFTFNYNAQQCLKIRGGAGKSLARLTSRCRRTESIVLLERGVVCSCAELQVFSCYRGWKEACQATRAISTTSRRELSSSFFFLQGKARKEIHANLTETLGENTPSYATVKNWVAQFKRGDFSTCDASRPGRPKKVTTPEIIDQIHEIILEDRRISDKSIAEQLDISYERVGSIIHEDLDMRKLSAKWVAKCLNADQKRQRCQSSEQILNFFGAIQMICCRARLVTMDETWLYHYDPETKQQSMEWRHSGSPRPRKIPSAKIRWKSSRLDFLGSRRHPPHWLSSKGANYQRGILLISAGQLKDILKEKCPGKVTKGVLFLLTGHLKPRRNWLTWASSVLITQPIFRIYPRRTTTCSMDWKNNWKVAISHPTRRSLLLRRPGWTDKILIFFFEWLA